MRLEAQQSGRIWKHRPRIRSRESFAFEKLEKHLGVTASHVGVRLTLGGCVTEVPPAFDYLLRRAAANSELQPTIADQVSCAGILEHVERILVSHVDHARPYLDSLCSGTDCCEQREGR